MEIFAFTQATYGRIRLAGLLNGMTVNVEYLPASGEKGQRRKKGERNIAGANEAAGDLAIAPCHGTHDPGCRRAFGRGE